MASKFLQIENKVVVSVFTIPAIHAGKTVAELLTPELAASMVEVDESVEVEAGWRVVGKGYKPPTPAKADPPARIRRISPLSFRRRLDPGTRQIITLTASRHLEEGDATVQMFLDDLSASGFVDLDHGDTLAGVAALRQLGLISEEQQAALLADGTEAEAV